MEKLFEELREKFDPDRDYLAAVSGGIDSMVMLHVLRAAGFGKLTICHVNHGLRGDDASRDEEFVREAAAKAGLDFESAQIDVAHEAERARISIETAARKCRYRFFSQVAERLDCPRVFLAHHADDQVETVLINLFRGSGLHGIAGMRQESVLEVDGFDLTLIRPFLSLWRSDIEKYASENNIDYREDESNQDDFALRNRVRHQLIPRINGIFERDVRGAVFRFAELAHKQEEWMEQTTTPIPFAKKGGLEVSVLNTIPAAERDRIILKWLRVEGVPDCGFAEVKKVASVLETKGKPAKVNLPGGIHARRRSGVLFLEFPG